MINLLEATTKKERCVPPRPAVSPIYGDTDLSRANRRGGLPSQSCPRSMNLSGCPVKDLPG